MIDFRDWKWISDYTRFSAEFNESEIITGEKEGSIDVDLSIMQTSDNNNKSKYEVSGRMFYEAHAFGYMI